MTPRARLANTRPVAADPPGGREIYSISALNEAARATLENRLGHVWVEGEISNIARPASGHVYFSLKDSRAQIRCAMFRNRSRSLGFDPDNGLAVVASGRVSIYTARGDYQLIVESLEAAGDGLLRLRYEQLKQRLFEQGLFDEARKRELPSWPRAIGVVTSPSGAAVRDIITVLARRCPMIPVILYPAAVQGATAAADIEAAIGRANRRAECDVLIVGRGGGSLEDLWPFNEERVALAIDASDIPVVSAVGHEVDVTIADFVADLRAATPSAAAELVSPDTVAARKQCHSLGQRLVNATRAALASRLREVGQLRARLLSPRRQLENSAQRVDELAQRLAHAVDMQQQLRRGRLHALTTRIAARSPVNTLTLMQSRLTHLHQRLAAAVNQRLAERRQALGSFEAVLKAMGPGATLERGYALVADSEGRLVRSAADVAPGSEITTTLARGKLVSEVTTAVLPSAENDQEQE